MNEWEKKIVMLALPCALKFGAIWGLKMVRPFWYNSSISVVCQCWSFVVSDLTNVSSTTYYDDNDDNKKDQAFFGKCL